MIYRAPFRQCTRLVPPVRAKGEKLEQQQQGQGSERPLPKERHTSTSAIHAVEASLFISRLASTSPGIALVLFTVAKRHADAAPTNLHTVQ
jgi:hypothetical protein